MFEERGPGGGGLYNVFPKKSAFWPQPFVDKDTNRTIKLVVTKILGNTIYTPGKESF